MECSKCNSILNDEDVYCPNCGYPERADESEKGKYEYRIKLKKDVLEDAEKKMKSVKILLYVIAGLNFAMGLYYLSEDLTFYDGIGSLIAAGIFIACVVWVNKQPLTGILAAFIFWILLQLSVVLVDPALIFSGIILKVVFIAIFIKGINSARDYQKFSQQLKEINVS
ncbi:MAG: hypothetical protein KI791_10410 [Cyclobacteriaceae bacterium]|nr:hypothetical protein [Cyclobacteriaceae bacterium SS2]